MSIVTSLEKLRPIWLNLTLQTLARGKHVRENFQDELTRFFDALVEVAKTGDSGWIDPILADWSTSLTETDLENYQSNLFPILRQIVNITYDVCRENLDDREALLIIDVLLPSFIYVFEKASQYELQVRINYISGQLNQAQQTLEKLERSKSDFISVAAHELKTPLTLVEGYSSMLQEAINLGDISGQSILLNGIHNGAQRLRGIIDDMIDVSMIDNNLMSLNFQPVWINRLLSALNNEVEKIVNERNQKLILAPFPGSNEMTYGDPERLLQVFRNVIMNAIKYTPDGKNIYVDGRKLPGFVEVTIRDTGIGIDIDDQQTIFEKFGRLGNTSLHSSGKTKFKGGGPGLGLHIAKGIIEAHGGAIWVESPGYDEINYPGSTFHIMFPLRNESPDVRTNKLFAPLSRH